MSPKMRSSSRSSSTTGVWWWVWIQGRDSADSCTISRYGRKEAMCGGGSRGRGGDRRRQLMGPGCGGLAEVFLRSPSPGMLVLRRPDPPSPATPVLRRHPSLADDVVLRRPTSSFFLAVDALKKGLGIVMVAPLPSSVDATPDGEPVTESKRAFSPDFPLKPKQRTDIDL
ncbi:hypothetical protein U9M48_007627 [Paspalum notatum var. saurae]|uniref:Uncharacterized protein n=1 Tax=Paspalum notatum var. saurae TaxID=547442 RepID=A0AAQ3SMM7_PASNO